MRVSLKEKASMKKRPALDCAVMLQTGRAALNTPGSSPCGLNAVQLFRVTVWSFVAVQVFFKVKGSEWGALSSYGVSVQQTCA